MKTMRRQVIAALLTRSRADGPEYAALGPAKNAAATRKAREVLGKPRVKQDALLREQLGQLEDKVRVLQVAAGAAPA